MEVGVGHLFHTKVFNNSKDYDVLTEKYVKTKMCNGQRTPRRSKNRLEE